MAQGVTKPFGAAGTTSPYGSGVLGWLRGIFNRLSPLPAPVFGGQAVTTSESAVPAAGAKAGRATMSVKALAANGAEVYIRHVTGATTLNSWELSAGDSIDIDADDTATILAVAASGTQRICTAEI